MESVKRNGAEAHELRQSDGVTETGRGASGGWLEGRWFLATFALAAMTAASLVLPHAVG